MKTNTISLCEYRKAYNISLLDMAYLLKVDFGNLSRQERELREPSLKTYLIYHILFGRHNHIDYFKEHYKELEEQVLQRAHALIAELEEEGTPKSINRLQPISKIVNQLEHKIYE